MKGVLLRVGIDQTYGGMNAPVDPDSLEFVYLPIPEDVQNFTEGCETRYSDFSEKLENFSDKHKPNYELALPDSLRESGCHLDPDFQYLTYGDQNSGRGNKVGKLLPGDFIAFFASLNPIKAAPYTLLYALIGLYFVKDIQRAGKVDDNVKIKNAHTRITNIVPNDIVIFANPENSGRLTKCIPIGSFRNKAYRVTEELLEAWGGLDIKDGFIQRSVNPPSFLQPEKFLHWFEHQNPELIASNN